jgi:hypothetical protein
MFLAAAARSSPGGTGIIASLTIETISRGTKEMNRLTLTVQGCYWLSKIRMTVVELQWKSAAAGKHFAYLAKNQANTRRKTNWPTRRKHGSVDFKGGKLKRRWHAAQENTI